MLADAVNKQEQLISLPAAKHNQILFHEGKK